MPVVLWIASHREKEKRDAKKGKKIKGQSLWNAAGLADPDAEVWQSWTTQIEKLQWNYGSYRLEFPPQGLFWKKEKHEKRDFHFGSMSFQPLSDIIYERRMTSSG